MTMQNPQPKPDPKPEPMSEQDAEALLPWYANGRARPRRSARHRGRLEDFLGPGRNSKPCDANAPPPSSPPRPPKRVRDPAPLRQLDPPASFAGPYRRARLYRIGCGAASGRLRPVLQFTLAACLAVVASKVSRSTGWPAMAAIYPRPSGRPESGSPNRRPGRV